jgi:hypothetical protein
MNKLRQIILGSFLCLLIVSPFRVSAQSTINEEVYRAVLLQLIDNLLKQIEVLEARLEDKTFVSRVEISPENMGDKVVTEETYKIRRASDVSEIMNREHREYFARVFELFPDEYDEKIRKLEVFDPDKSNFDAYVETIAPDHEYWSYAVNGEIIAEEEAKGNTELIIHELSHLVSYEEVLGVPKPANTRCHVYFKVHGCPQENSYLGQFIEEFWGNSDLNRAKEFADSRDAIDAAEEYFELYKNEYVTDYAALGPEEDFAESFTFFVLGESPKRGTLANEKVDFFSGYQELNSIKAEVASEL